MFDLFIVDLCAFVYAKGAPRSPGTVLPFDFDMKDTATG
jgi:hypothetical protein